MEKQKRNRIFGALALTLCLLASCACAQGWATVRGQSDRVHLRAGCSKDEPSMGLYFTGCPVWVTGEDLKVLEVSWLLQELAGKRVPEDISLIGFENAGISEFQRPSLTTVATPLAAMAERAVELVTCEGASSLPRVKECFGTRFIERNSVQRLG